MAPPRPHALQEVNAVNAGGSHHPPGKVTRQCLGPQSHREPKCKMVGSRGPPHGILHPPGPPEAGGSPSGRQMGYLYFGSGHGVQENQHGHQGACQDAVLDFPEAEQERHAEGQQVQPWERGSS